MTFNGLGRLFFATDAYNRTAERQTGLRDITVKGSFARSLPVHSVLSVSRADARDLVSCESRA